MNYKVKQIIVSTLCDIEIEDTIQIKEIFLALKIECVEFAIKFPDLVHANSNEPAPVPVWVGLDDAVPFAMIYLSAAAAPNPSVIVTVPATEFPPVFASDGPLDCTFIIPDPKEPAAIDNVSPEAYPVPKADGVIDTVAIFALPVTPIGAPVVTVAVALSPLPFVSILTNLDKFGSKSSGSVPCSNL